MFLEALSDCGVKFFILSHLSKTYLDGASFLDGSNPVIVYTGRYNRLDNFWWTMSHEIIHVLFHIKNKKDCYLDNLDDRTNISEQEMEADNKTQELFNTDAIINKGKAFKSRFTEDRLNQIAEEVSLCPSMVIGILHHHKVLDYRVLAKIKTTITDKIPEKYFKG